MDEARRVIERLERIEVLRRREAPAAALLAEVRGLLHDGEAWLAAEREAPRGAEAALNRCRERLRDDGEVMSGRTGPGL
jgi:hypothetical protein